MNDKIMRANVRLAFAAVLAIVAGSFAFPAAALAKKDIQITPQHYRVAIDAKAALKDLLPTLPRNALPRASIIGDLALVPEVQLCEPLIVPPMPKAMVDPKKMAQLREEHSKACERAIVHLARLTAHVNFINKTKTDRFVELLIENRPDLAGLPFTMGDACRLKAGERKQFKTAVEILQGSGVPICGAWKAYDAERNDEENKDVQDRFCAAACMQLLAASATDIRLGMVPRLAAFDKTDKDKQAATQALTRLAIFSQLEVRRAAIDALRKRNQGCDAAVVLHGLHYPWPAVAQNAADLISELKCKDLIPELVNMLDAPDPRAPAAREIKGRKTPVLRELVKVNHHRNCLLCHPPGNTPDVMTIEPCDSSKKEIEKGVEAWNCRITLKADDVLVGAAPAPGIAFSLTSNGYRRFSSPDILVRADITYLRQDFSLLQKVENAEPWPEMQRFDFLVRSRALTEEQAAAYQAEFARRKEPSPYHEAALAAVRSLTGQDAGTTAAAWRDALGMKN